MDKYLVEFAKRVSEKHGASTPICIDDINFNTVDKIYSALYDGKDVFEIWANCELLKDKKTYWSDSVRDLKNRMIETFFDQLHNSEYKTFGEFLEKFVN